VGVDVQSFPEVVGKRREVDPKTLPEVDPKTLPEAELKILLEVVEEVAYPYAQVVAVVVHEKEEVLHTDWVEEVPPAVEDHHIEILLHRNLPKVGIGCYYCCCCYSWGVNKGGFRRRRRRRGNWGRQEVDGSQVGPTIGSSFRHECRRRLPWRSPLLPSIRPAGAAVDRGELFSKRPVGQLPIPWVPCASPPNSCRNAT
jgi:hypothetical protein